MSINHLLEHNKEPEPWTHLRVKSIRANTIVTDPIVPATTVNVYLSPQGNDSNDGSSVGNAVASFSRAIDVALSNTAQELIINLSGTGNVSGFDSCDKDVCGYDELLDFTSLTNSYTYIRVKGERADEVTFAAGVAGTTAIAPYDKWSQLTGLTGLTNGLYTSGFISSGSINVTSSTNTTTTVDLVSQFGTEIAAQGFSIFNLSGPTIRSNTKWAILSGIPVIFEDCNLAGSNVDSDYIANSTGYALVFKNCNLTSNKLAGFMSEGAWTFFGCNFYGGSSNWELFVENYVQNIIMESCNLENASQEITLANQWTDINFVNFTLSCRGGGIEIINFVSNHSSGTNFRFQNSNLWLSSGYIQNSDNSVTTSCIHSTSCNVFTTDLTAIKLVGTSGYSINSDHNIWKHESDCTIESDIQSAIFVTGGSFTIIPSDSLTAVNRIYSASALGIQGQDACSIFLTGQDNKNVYQIISDVSVPIGLQASVCNIRAVQSNGPDLTSPATFAMALCEFGSTIIFGDDNYVNGGAGDDDVRLGVSTNVLPAVVGTASDILPTAGVIAPNSQACHLIVR